MNKLKDLIGSILKENYKNFDTKTDETNADIGTLGKNGTTNLIEKIRTELSKLRQFIGYDTIDTVDGKTGQYKLEKINYDSVFGYESDSEKGKVTTLLDYIKIFVSDKTDQNNIVKGLQDTLATINSKLTQLENDLKECAKIADLSEYVKSTTLDNYNTKDEIKNTYATKTEMTNYMGNYAEASTVFNIKKNLENNYYDKDAVDSKLATASSGMVKFDNSANTYYFSILENNGLTDIVLNFSESYQGLVKFVKVNGTVYPVISNGKFNNDNNRIPIGSLVQIGCVDGGKLIITEPVWVAIQDGGALGKAVDIIHSI